MSETKYYVDDEALKVYTPQIKGWFQEKIDSVPMMDLVYHEDERILEFVESAK